MAVMSLALGGTGFGNQTEAVNVQNSNHDNLEEKLDFITREGASAQAFLTAIELKRGLEDTNVMAHLQDGILNYIAASGMVAFAGRDIDDESVGRLLSSIDIAPDPTMLQILHTLHYKTYSIYVNSFYFMMTLGMEPTLDGILNIARAMEATLDVQNAQYALDFCKKFTSGELNADLSSGLKGEALSIFQKLEEVIHNLFSEISNVVMRETKRLMHDKRLSQFSEADLLPFLASIGLLGFCSRDQTSDNIEKVMYAVGISKNEELLELSGSLHVRNQIAYLIGLFFLLVAGVEPNVDRILKIVRVLGIAPDILVADYVVALYRIKKFAGGLKK